MYTCKGITLMLIRRKNVERISEPLILDLLMSCIGYSYNKDKVIFLDCQTMK